ncbi:MAG: hypothetical protein ACLFR0_03950 [Alphaproteobacteria bacterium]
MIAAAFATALPMSAMAQDMQTMEPMGEPPASEDVCLEISATEQFCAAADAPVIPIQTPQGQFFGVPGRVESGEQTNDSCLLILHPQTGPVGVQCEAPQGPE